MGKPAAYIAEAAGCSESMVKHVRRDPAFLEALRQVLRDALAPMLPAVLDAAFRSALIVGRHGFTDRWRLLELGGFGRPQGDGGKAPAQHNHLHLHGRLAEALAHRERSLQQLQQLAEGDERHAIGTVEAELLEEAQEASVWDEGILSN